MRKWDILNTTSVYTLEQYEIENVLTAGEKLGVIAAMVAVDSGDFSYITELFGIQARNTIKDVHAKLMEKVNEVKPFQPTSL